MDNLDLTDIQQLLQQFIQAVRDDLKQQNINASSKLSQSLKSVVKQKGKWIEISISLEDYWKYIEYGTRPHFPPIQAIRKWIDVKPVLPRPMKGKLPTRDQLAFLIARKISKVGTRPKPFLNKTISDFNLIDKVYDLLLNQIQQQINKQINDELE
jgi:hypothetical protein